MSFRTNAGRGSNGHGVALFATTAGTGATQLVLTTAPGTGGASPYTVSPTPVVTAKSGSGVTDTSFVGVVTCTLNVLSGSPVLSGTTTKTAVAGVADFSANGLTVTGAGTWTLTFSSGSLSPAVSATGTTTSSAATKLTITTAPGLSGTSPYTLSPQPVVAAQNAGNTTDTSYVTNVVATLNVLTGSPVLSGTTTKTPVSGVATFTDLVVTGAGTWTITFTSGTLTSATSSTGTTTSGFTAFDAAFNFRLNNTDAGFTNIEASGEAVCIGETYPHTFTMTTTGQSASAGFTNSQVGSGRNRSTTVDRRLAGIIFDGGASTLIFKADVVAGATYTVVLAVGDPTNSGSWQATVKDGATTLFTAGPTAIASGHAIDAFGTDFTDAAWPGSNVGRSVTMTGTVLSVEVPAGQPFQHVRITRTA